ncbi:uncharacterized protein NFIA_077060 [Aspergillus fischeri NRRL 181]|uniref:Uncharacterized protein n=1 Tax=Neosartorya fischeri (strain ATCC 1020 / DSM 3700 / CBS 544.65 / FGSC A1164 / JCM 1740 / NRRL 181 / WB 181) TaxID=331117 RepID=A1DEG6_NEOFI|nr:conserved hypothetical protein [Aspergillus fischeri NRRL 181]EAW17773.1 conserved hypothetical protein [Aspergillus fischeri NRRL 181]KAG2012640.1 hypothetical protein GB937_006989 [Aspergillus fischeri]
MCRYIFHHYTGCGHIANFDFRSCVEVINLLRGLSQPGSNSPDLICTNVKVEHDLCSPEMEVYCLQCEIDFQAEGAVRTISDYPDYISIEGIDSSDPVITTKMQWQVPRSRKRDFNEAFLDLDLDGDHKSDSSNDTTVQPNTIANASITSSPELWHDFVDVPLNAHDQNAVEHDEEDHCPNPPKKRNDSISEDYVVIGTDILTTQAERLTSRAGDEGDEDEDEDDFYTLWLSDSDSDSGDGDIEDDSKSLIRQLERFTFPNYRSTPRSPDIPISPRTRPCPDPLPLYVGFPGQPPERSPRTLRPSSRGGYLDARTDLQSPIFDGFPGIYPDEEELGLRSPGLVSFPRILIKDVDEEEKKKEQEKEKVEAGKSTGKVLDLSASLASGSGCAAALLKGLNFAMQRK